MQADYETNKRRCQSKAFKNKPPNKIESRPKRVNKTEKKKMLTKIKDDPPAVNTTKPKTTTKPDRGMETD